MADAGKVAAAFLAEIERFNAIVSAAGTARYDEVTALAASLTRLIAFGELLPPPDSFSVEEASLSAPDPAPLPPTRERVEARFADFGAYPFILPLTEDIGRAAGRAHAVDDVIAIHRDLNAVLAIYDAGFPNAALHEASLLFSTRWGRHALNLKSFIYAYVYDA